MNGSIEIIRPLNRLNISDNQQMTNGSNRSNSRKTPSGKKPIDDKYEILHQIGRGSYASVYKAIDREAGKIFAIKKIPWPKDAESQTYLMNEIKIMSECEHNNIVRYLESDSSFKEVSIVMEYCRGGSVKDVMRQLNLTLDYEQILSVLQDVLHGLDYLHSKEKVHRDVKAANILLAEDGVAKLADFGVSEPSEASTRHQSIIGTVLWIPPEVINRTIDAEYSSAIDIWSLGITIIEMADGQPPNSKIDQKAAFAEIADLSKPSPTFLKPALWPKLSEFLALCLEKQASKRKGARELLKHEIFNNPPTRESISKLVEKVYLRSTGTESDLCRRSESSLKEICALFGIYKERRMKVVKVDQMTKSLHSIEESFRKIHDGMLTRDAEIEQLSSQLVSLDKEIRELSRQKDDLRTKLEFSVGRKLEIEDQIKKIRRSKLRSLESNNG